MLRVVSCYHLQLVCNETSCSSTIRQNDSASTRLPNNQRAAAKVRGIAAGIDLRFDSDKCRAAAHDNVSVCTAQEFHRHLFGPAAIPRTFAAARWLR